jgi:predicted HTH domain antitoxin
MKVITTRIDDKYFEDLKIIEKEEARDRAEVIRRLLAIAIKEWKIKKSLELLKKHKITMRKAASIAGVSYVEMLDLSSQEDIDSGYTIKDLQEDLKK